MIIEGFDVNERDALHCSPLHYAVLHGNKKAVEVLLYHGAEANTRSADSFETPLHIAAKKGFYAIVRMLINHGADIHVTDREWNTPLCLAVKNGRKKVARLIIRYGSDR
jgi:ankyrin repeat protein